MLIQSTKGASVDRIKGIILGASGVGKTFLASTFGEPGKTLLISVESGHLTLNNFDIPMIDVTTDTKDGQTITLNDAQRYEKIIKILAWLKGEDARKRFKNIYVDGISEIGNVVIRKYENDSYWGQSKMLKPRYAEYTKTMTNLIVEFRDLPFYNVWFTALVEQKQDRDEKTGQVIKSYPASILMPGAKIPENVPAFFDEVLYYGMKGEKRYLLTQATDEAFAKDRSGRLDKFEKPNLAEVSNKIKGA